MLLLRNEVEEREPFEVCRLFEHLKCVAESRMEDSFLFSSRVDPEVLQNNFFFFFNTIKPRFE